MKKTKSLRRRISERLQLPPQLLAGTPKAELLGRETVVISGCKGLTNYTDQRISARTKAGELSVTGSMLSIVQMDAETLTVSGRIAAVSFSEDGR